MDFVPWAVVRSVGSEASSNSQLAKPGATRFRAAEATSLGSRHPGVVSFVHPALQVLKLGAVDGMVSDDALPPDLRFDEIHGSEAKGPQQQAEGNSQNNRHDGFVMNECGEMIVCVHGILPKNPSLNDLNLCFTFTSWPLDFTCASFCTGRVARSATLVGERPAGRGFKRGGACLHAHGLSSSVAARATHRGAGR